jgi:hypothetical protein
MIDACSHGPERMVAMVEGESCGPRGHETGVRSSLPIQAMPASYTRAERNSGRVDGPAVGLDR